MKINEIAIKENLLTKGAQFVGKALPRVERLPGETMQDAITRAKSELGGVKSADNLVSPEEMAALRRDPVPSSGPVAGTNPSTGFLVPGRVIPTQANTSYNLNLPKTPAAADAVPSSGPAVWRGRGDSVPGRAPPTAPWVKPQVWRGRPPSEPVALSQQNPTTGPAAINLQAAERMRQATAAKRAPKAPADDLAKQIRPGTDTPKTPGGRQEPGMDPPAAGENKFSIDDVERLFKAGQSAAAQAAAKEAGIDLSKPGNMFTRNPWKTGIGVAAIPDLYNQFSPPTAPKLPYTPGEAAIDLGKYFSKNFMANRNIPTVTSVTPVSNNDQSVTPPSQDAVDKAIKSNPENQAVTKEIEQWNRDHPDNPIKESYTNELNRLVFLSRP